MLLGDLPVKY